MIGTRSKFLALTLLLTAPTVMLSACASAPRSIDQAFLYEAQDDDFTAGWTTAAIIAPDASSADALAGALRERQPGEGIALVDSRRGVEAMILASDGQRLTSAGWDAKRRQLAEDAQKRDTKDQKPKANPNWPTGYELRIDVSLAQVGARNYRRPYVAVWVERSDGKVARYVSVWGTRAKYQSELRNFYPLTRYSSRAVDAVTRPTRPAGQYTLRWDGLDNAGEPVAAGEYTVHVEAAREHGTRQHVKTAITCKGSAQEAKIEGNVEVSGVVVRFGPAKE